MWAPTSEPFSMTQTPSSRSAAAASCFRRIAAASPDGPGPDDDDVVLHPLALDSASSPTSAVPRNLAGRLYRIAENASARVAHGSIAGMTVRHATTAEASTIATPRSALLRWYVADGRGRGDRRRAGEPVCTSAGGARPRCDPARRRRARNAGPGDRSRAAAGSDRIAGRGCAIGAPARRRRRDGRGARRAGRRLRRLRA